MLLINIKIIKVVKFFKTGLKNKLKISFFAGCEKYMSLRQFLWDKISSIVKLHRIEE
jgi:hypothetical protein